MMELLAENRFTGDTAAVQALIEREMGENQ